MKKTMNGMLAILGCNLGIFVIFPGLPKGKWSLLGFSNHIMCKGETKGQVFLVLFLRE